MEDGHSCLFDINELKSGREVTTGRKVGGILYGAVMLFSMDTSQKKAEERLVVLSLNYRVLGWDEGVN